MESTDYSQPTEGRLMRIPLSLHPTYKTLKHRLLRQQESGRRALPISAINNLDFHITERLLEKEQHRED